LSNYDIEKNPRKAESIWYTSIQYGTGKGFPIQKINDKFYENIKEIILQHKEGKRFLKYINNGFSEKIGKASELQKLYEQQKSSNKFTEPTELIDLIQEKINNLNIENKVVNQDCKVFKYKEKIPLKQFFALY